MVFVVVCPNLSAIAFFFNNFIFSYFSICDDQILNNKSQIVFTVKSNYPIHDSCYEVA